MNELFGLSMTAIMIALLILLGICLAGFGLVYLRARVMFRMGVRNIGRRRAQTGLIVAGLTLATAIITAAFTTGDVVAYSATTTTYDNLQRTDLSIHHFRPVSGAIPLAQTYADEAVTPGLEALFQADPDIEAFMPFLYEPVPVLNQRTRLSEPSVVFAGADGARLDAVGGPHLTSGGRVSIASLAGDEVVITAKTADKLDAVKGDVLTVFGSAGPTPVRVAGIVEEERSAGVLEFGSASSLGMAGKLGTVQAITGHAGKISTINVALRGDVRSSLQRSSAAAARLEAFQKDEDRKAEAGLGGVAFQVEEIKRDAVDGAELAGSIFVTVFLMLGLFSIAAGAMLIFTLFVMLAAERRTEMGIARAVGAQRSHLVEMFISEGMVYDLAAGLVGVLLGVAAALGIVVGLSRLLIGDVLGFIQPHVTLRSLVVSFCLGTVLTFATVGLSSLQISRLNIVSAVRGQSDREPAHRDRHGVRWRWIAAGVPATLLLPPLGFYWVLRKGFGLPGAWLTGPGGVASGIALVALGEYVRLSFFVTLGMSFVILGAGATAQSLGASRRATWSVAGVVLAAYWLAPAGVHQALFGKLDGNMEMFVLSGIMIVTGFTLVIVFNARLLTPLFAAQRKGPKRYAAPVSLAALTVAAALMGWLGGDLAGGLGQASYVLAAFFAMFTLLSMASVRISRIAPAMKMAIAYPLANRFRTGMTIAMFALVIFSITAMGIINTSFLGMFSTEDGRGGWDILVNTNPNNPVPDLVGALRSEGSYDPAAITAVAHTTDYDDNVQRARNPGGGWSAYPIRAGDETFFRQAQMKLEGRARGYASAQEVFDAVANSPGLAIVDSSVVQNAFAGGNLALSADVTIKDGQYDAFQIEIGDKVTGKTQTVTVVGVLSAKMPPNLVFGVYVHETTYRALFGAPDYRTTLVRLAPGTAAVRAAKGIKAALVMSGVQAVSTKQSIDDAMAVSRGFLRIFQAFMGLGLFVGIAALGVIALRSVVERRQQIGMLRAIGYQRHTVALSFMLESSFIALAGILSGLVGATLLSWQLLSSDYFPGAKDLEFIVPWADMATYAGLSFLVALAMTWWPSQRAAAVPIAEALRYE